MRGGRHCTNWRPSIVPVSRSSTHLAGRAGRHSLQAIVKWYFRTVYGRSEGPGVTPFYCDRKLVGAFAVEPQELLRPSDATLFRLFVANAMFQARRDVLIMQQQRTMPPSGVRALAVAGSIKSAIANSDCVKVLSPETFDQGCDVKKRGGEVDCDFRPGLSCHVKQATMALARTGDMGKLSTSAWLHLWNKTGLRSTIADVVSQDARPNARAALLVERLSIVHRVGRKLATMFVSALSTPALAPGLTPWFPEIDGNELVVVDTNVARAIDTLGGHRVGKTYVARAHWLRERAAEIDLRMIRPGLPRYSPRLVQQALYRFCSKSNRTASVDPCRLAGVPCMACVPSLCPFTSSRPRQPRVRGSDATGSRSPSLQWAQPTSSRPPKAG